MPALGKLELIRGANALPALDKMIEIFIACNVQDMQNTASQIVKKLGIDISNEITGLMVGLSGPTIVTIHNGPSQIHPSCW